MRSVWLLLVVRFMRWRQRRVIYRLRVRVMRMIGRIQGRIVECLRRRVHGSLVCGVRGVMKQFYQCRLRMGTLETTGWIEARGAKLGSYVELLPDREQWEVVEVFALNVMAEESLKETQRLNRRSLPSVEP